MNSKIFRDTASFHVGQRIVIGRLKSVLHNQAGDIPIIGTVIDIQDNHYVGYAHRPINVRLDDGSENWWQPWELFPAHQETYNPDHVTISIPTDERTPPVIHQVLSCHFPTNEMKIILHAAQTNLNEHLSHTDYDITAAEAKELIYKIYNVLAKLS